MDGKPFSVQAQPNEEEGGREEELQKGQMPFVEVKKQKKKKGRILEIESVLSFPSWRKCKAAHSWEINSLR